MAVTHESWAAEVVRVDWTDSHGPFLTSENDPT